MATRIFTLSDNPKVSPEMLTPGASILVNCSCDAEVHRVCTAAALAADMPLSTWSLAAIRDHMQGDMDIILLALLEGRGRRKVCSQTRHHQFRCYAPYTGYLKDAQAFLKEKGYPMVSTGALVEACLILRADSENLLPRVN